MAQYFPVPDEHGEYFRKRLATGVSAEQAEERWEQFQSNYRRFVEEAQDIGGKKNPMYKHLYGVISCFAWYETLDSKPSEEVLREVIRDNTVKGDRISRFSRININNPVIQRVVYAIIGIFAKKTNRKKADGSWGNTWGISVNPLRREEGISVHLVGCPIADFAKSHGYEHLMPLFCESDYESMQYNLGKTLQREQTVAEGFEECDYWIKNN